MHVPINMLIHAQIYILFNNYVCVLDLTIYKTFQLVQKTCFLSIFLFISAITDTDEHL